MLVCQYKHPVTDWQPVQDVVRLWPEAAGIGSTSFWPQTWSKRIQNRLLYEGIKNYDPTPHCNHLPSHTSPDHPAMIHFLFQGIYQSATRRFVCIILSEPLAMTWKQSPSGKKKKSLRNVNLSSESHDSRYWDNIRWMVDVNSEVHSLKGSHYPIQGSLRKTCTDNITAGSIVSPSYAYPCYRGDTSGTGLNKLC